MCAPSTQPRTGPDEGCEPDAAPLLCAGITTYAPLRKWGAGPGTKVAVVGLGGLGHMAVKLAHAMGAEVTVLSQSLLLRPDHQHRQRAEHQIGSEVEVIAADQINEAYERVLASNVRYRFVIDTSTLV